MGIPIGPTFANIFMCHHEANWMDECPLAFRPRHYFRYLDDTFLLFQSKNQCIKFYEYLNTKHPNIKFTLEHENNNSLSFLDVNVTRMNGRFQTTVYRKPSFTGLGTSFFSFCCTRFKMNGIQTLLHRAYCICSNATLFHKEVSFLKQFFFQNGYARAIFERQTEIFLSKKLEPKIPMYMVDKNLSFSKLCSMAINLCY